MVCTSLACVHQDSTLAHGTTMMKQVPGVGAARMPCTCLHILALLVSQGLAGGGNCKSASSLTFSSRGH